MTPRTHFDFAGKLLPLAEPHVMGILNLTVDSFSDGGELLVDGHLQLDAVLYRAASMVEAGAALLDLGGESTRPGAQGVSEQEELDRVLPVLEALRARFDVVLSLDTSSPPLMREGARLGAGLINDVRALSRAGALDAVRDTGLPVCLMHMQGEPRTMQQAPCYDDVLREVSEFLLGRAWHCLEAGIVADKLLLDPGFGFGKNLTHNLVLLQNLERLVEFGYPVLAGLSRKRMLGDITGHKEKARLFAGLAAAVIAVNQGAWIIRTHDVAATVDAVKVCRAVALAGKDEKGESKA
ncbi:MAG: dihydropteroate synthase [Pseudomonadales bacterium]|jgi:dihydropteroate synthase|nr:dihydropteroate synthase [Pseudomonadales bacterium]